MHKKQVNSSIFFYKGKRVHILLPFATSSFSLCEADLMLVVLKAEYRSAIKLENELIVSSRFCRALQSRYIEVRRSIFDYPKEEILLLLL